MRQAIMFEMQAVIKAHTDNGRRIVEVEASNENVDMEGDVILQAALLGSKDSFIKNGHLDIDHYSEIGDRLTPPITNPASYIVGRPLEVKDIGHGRTAVVGEIARSADGKTYPERYQYDMLWESLQQNPPVQWRASVFGYPIADQIEDCSRTTCTSGATRFLVKGLDWRSLAFTRTPMNDSIIGFARAITAKSFISALRKNDPLPGEDFEMMAASTVPPRPPRCPENIDEMWGEYLRHILRECPHNDKDYGNTIAAFRNHYMACRGLPFDKADILAHAMMYLIIKERRHGRR